MEEWKKHDGHSLLSWRTNWKKEMDNESEGWVIYGFNRSFHAIFYVIFLFMAYYEEKQQLLRAATISCELLSKLLVSPLITLLVVPYIIPYINLLQGV